MAVWMRKRGGGGWGIAISLAMLVIVGLVWWGMHRVPAGAGNNRRPPTDSVADSDTRIRAAEKEARTHWKEFIGLWQARQPGQRFFVKAGFSDFHVTEPLWVFVDGIDRDTITGTIDVDPQAVGNLSMGSHVSFKTSKVDDWLFEGEHDRRGGFTIKVLDEIAKEREAREAAKRAATRPATAPSKHAVTEPTTRE